MFKIVSKNANSVTFTRWTIATWLRSNHSIYVTRYKDKPLRYPYDEIDKYTEDYKEKFR